MSVSRMSVGSRRSYGARDSSFARLSTSSTSAAATALYSGTLSWEAALGDVLSVLKIQYRSDSSISSFLVDSERVRQLTYSAIARMEYNRRCIREEVDSGIYSPPRARRIAKEVAIDYIRRFLDGEEDRIEMVRKIQNISSERDAVLDQVCNMEEENAGLKKEKDVLHMEHMDVLDAKADVEDKLAKTNDDLTTTQHELDETNHNKRTLEGDLTAANRDLENSREDNERLRQELSGLKTDFEKSRQDNDSLRNECQSAWKQSSERRDEISKLTHGLEVARHGAASASAAADAAKKKNGELNNKNEKLREKNLCLRDENNVLRAREDEMRTLVQVQLTLLSPESAQSDLANAARTHASRPSTMSMAPAQEPVEELTEEEEASEEEVAEQCAEE